MGGGLADGFARADAEHRGEERVLLGVGIDDGGELADGRGTGDGGDTRGLELGAAGERVEHRGDFGMIEDREQVGDGEAVGGGEVVELLVGAEVVLEEGIEELGIGEEL
ncbi:MAG TPA: hypothetical protein VFF69_13925, partial [Phycisphaerales bacterium]|nr:hypothetical protein [Phycisphaerales bacterium]